VALKGGAVRVVWRQWKRLWGSTLRGRVIVKARVGGLRHGLECELWWQCIMA